MRATGPDLRTRQAVIDRDQRRCVRCGEPMAHIHHRRPRGMGGSRDPLTNRTANLVCLCPGCHDWIERHRADAYRDGWLVHRWDDPAEVAILLPDGWEMQLNNDGGAERAPVAFLPAGLTPPF